MKITAGHFYFVSDKFFEKVDDANLKMNYETTQRPHYFALQDKNIFALACSLQLKG